MQLRGHVFGVSQSGRELVLNYDKNRANDFRKPLAFDSNLPANVPSLEAKEILAIHS